jgi:hypothetical protein
VFGVVLAHGLLVRVNASFERVKDVFKPGREFSNVYFEVLKTRPRIAIAVGEKYFFRAGNYLTVTMILIEEERSTLVKAIATGGRRGLMDFFDLGSSRDYARESINNICALTRATCEVLREVEYLDASKSELLKT